MNWYDGNVICCCCSKFFSMNFYDENQTTIQKRDSDFSDVMVGRQTKLSNANCTVFARTYRFQVMTNHRI